MIAVNQDTSLPVIAHNRWWSASTQYAKQNGGQYDFVIDKISQSSLPADPSFWNDLSETQVFGDLKSMNKIG